MEPEETALGQYLDRGGRVLLLLEPGVEVGLKNVLASWKVDVGDNMIIELNPLGRLFGASPATPVIMQYERHTITQGFQVTSIFPTARTVSVGSSGGDGAVSTTSLAKTTPNSWGEVNYKDPTGRVERGPDDVAGPVSIAVTATKSTASATAKLFDEARLVVYGDSEFANNRFFSMQGNKDLFLNTMNWLAEEVQKISIRPKERKSSRLFLTDAQSTTITFGSMILLPQVLLGLGIAIWAIRRGK